MKSCRPYPALYFLFEYGTLEALGGGYVNDLLRSGDSDFRKLSKLKNKRFEMKE